MRSTSLEELLQKQSLGVDMRKPLVRILMVGCDLADYRRLEGLFREITSTSYQLQWCQPFDLSHLEEAADNYDIVLLDCCHHGDEPVQFMQQARMQGCSLPFIALTE